MKNPQYKLVCTKTDHGYNVGDVLTYADEQQSYGGPWGWMQGEGKAEWQPNLPTAEELAQEILTQLESVVDSFMDSKAKVFGFKDRHSFALRAGIVGSSWHDRAVVFGAWMDSVNDYCYQVLLDCQANKRTVPTEAELLAELPELIYP